MCVFVLYLSFFFLILFEKKRRGEVQRYIKKKQICYRYIYISLFLYILKRKIKRKFI